MSLSNFSSSWLCWRWPRQILMLLNTYRKKKKKAVWIYAATAKRVERVDMIQNSLKLTAAAAFHISTIANCWAPTLLFWHPIRHTYCYYSRRWDRPPISGLLMSGEGSCMQDEMSPDSDSDRREGVTFKLFCFPSLSSPLPPGSPLTPPPPLNEVALQPTNFVPRAALTHTCSSLARIGFYQISLQSFSR